MGQAVGLSADMRQGILEHNRDMASNALAGARRGLSPARGSPGERHP